MQTSPEVIQKIDSFFQSLIDQQQAKTLEVARTLIPHLTADDILNPQDFPKLMEAPLFQYEEGITTGLLSAQVALRQFLKTSFSYELS